MKRFFHICSASLLLLLMWSHWYGWAHVNADRVPNVPRSVRDNPGSYRSIYTNYMHYSGGK